MRYLSLFSGIEAATVAWHPLGWECVGVSEIEPFPCAVLAHHYPNVPNLGDVTKITAADIAALGQIDLVVFGSPCQDLSVAGKRRGLAGERSGLFHTAIDIIEWAREFCGCRWALWENVPGAFSSNKGRDFATVVELLAGLDSADVPPKGWGFEGCAVGTEAMVEWAVLDAQWFGVAQRRRRVFALADFGDWAGRPPILLEPEGLRGDSAPRRKTGEIVTALTANGVGTCGADDNQAQAQAGHIRPVVGTCPETIGALDTECGFQKSTHQSINAGHLLPVVGSRMVAFGEYAQDETASCMKARDWKDATDLIVYGFQPRIGRNGRGDRGEVVNALTAQAGETGKGDAAPCVAFSAKDFGADATEELSPTLRAGNSHTANQNSGNWMALQRAMQVRRLTPVECERLQGFPDNYTLIPWKNKPADQCPDGPRYKALGNSMAVPVMRWIGQGIDAVALFQ